MATLKRRRAANAAGPFFVDDTCIDCDACRWLAPDTFAASGGMAYVQCQPETGPSLLRAQMALLACPVGAIGSTRSQDLAQARGSFPEAVEGDVYYCGYQSRKSYGASSYFIRRADGNVLIDSPRFTRPLIRRLEAMGGVRWMFLTHADDVADHERFRAHFACTRILHRADVSPSTRAVEIQPTGAEPVELAADLLLIPVPGHTRGSACLLFQERFLFTGDHVWWNPDRRRLSASRSVCWYDWRQQTASMRRLAAYGFEWVLPGHGRRVHLPTAQMAQALAGCIARMERRG